jgi:glycine cleavage system regulatory protein
MRVSLVLTVIGDDKPGLVEHLSDEILAAGANWEESRMARLAGKFAGILRLTIEPSQADRLTTALAALEGSGLKVVVERSDHADESWAPTTLGVELVGHDRPGVIRDISRVLTHRGVNIEELETEVTSAPMTGDGLFRARARLQMPPTLSVAELRSILESLAADLMVDLSIGDFDDR